MLTKEEKLAALEQLRNPEMKLQKILTDRSIAEAVMKMTTMQGIKGEDGYTPLKGKDYFTEDEINLIVNHIQSQVKDGEQGPQGIPGIGIPGKNGQTPVRLVDYWTREDQDRIMKDILRLIKLPKDGTSPKMEDIVSQVTERVKKTPVHLKDIQGTKELIEFLKLGGYRGGGGSSGTTSPLTTKGDIYVFSTVNTRLPVGADGFVLSADSTQTTGLKWIAAAGTGTVTSVATGTGLTGGPITTTGTISLADTAVTPGAYTSANITIDQQGRITAAANGTGGGGVTSVTGTANRITSTGGTTPVIDISASYVGQASIITVGTILTGGYQAGPVLAGVTGSNTTATANAQVLSATSSQYVLGVFGQTLTLTASNNFGSILVRQNTLTIPASGTNILVSNAIFRSNIINTGAGTVTNSATVYIEGASTGTASITNNYSLWVNAGLARFDGHMLVEGVTSTGATGTGAFVFGTAPSISGATITTSTVNGVTLTTGGGTTTFLNANGAYSTPVGGVTSVSNVDATLTISPTTGAVVASINLAHANTWTGIVTLSPTARTSGVASYFTINAPADTGITASAESIGINHVGATRTWVDGTVPTQREYFFGAPTYNKTTTAAVFTQAGTVVISGAPIAGTGVTITNPYSLWVQGGIVHIGAQLGGSPLAPTLGTGMEISDSNNTDGGLILEISNTSNGVNAYTGVNLNNDLANGSTYTHFAGLYYNSSAYSTTTFGTGFAIVNQLALQNTDGPITYSAQNNSSVGYHNWLVRGTATTNEVMRLTNTGLTVGLSGTTTGLINLPGVTSGTVSLTTAAVAGTWTMTLPTTGGTSGWFLQTNGSGVTTWAAASGSGSPGGSDTQVQFNDAAAFGGSAQMTFAKTTGLFTLAPSVRTTGSPSIFTITSPADTTLTLSTESTSVNLNLSAIRQFATGALTTQREMRIQAPTYAFVGASTITNASTLDIGGFPIAGTNATITSASALSFSVAPKASATSAMINLSNNALASANSAGTYIGANPAAYTGDFFNWQINNIVYAKLSQASSGGSLSVGDSNSFHFQTTPSITNINPLGGHPGGSTGIINFNNSTAWDDTNAGGVTDTLVRISGTTSPSSGNTIFNSMNVNPTIAQTSTATGVTRGIVITPVLTTAFDWRAFEIAAYTHNLLSTTTLAQQQTALIGQTTLANAQAQTVTAAATVRITGAPIKSTNVTLTQTAALQIDAGAVSTATNSYGAIINAQTGATNNYAAYLNGRVGISTAAPTALLHIGAGTATASTAPLKFTSGTNLTTAEAGAMEFDGTNLFFTPTGTIRKTIATAVTGRQTAQTAADASIVTETVGAADASYMISANVLITTSTVHSFTATVTYTDEGNTSRTVTLQFSTVAGAFVTAIANAAGAVPYEGVPLHIRCKSGTTITLATTGTFTTVTYNVEGRIALMN